MQRTQKFFVPCRLRRAAENVQAIPDLQILHVAEIGIEPRKLIVVAHVALGAALGQESGVLGAIEIVAARELGAAAVEAIAERILREV